MFISASAIDRVYPRELSLRLSTPLRSSSFQLMEHETKREQPIAVFMAFGTQGDVYPLAVSNSSSHLSCCSVFDASLIFYADCEFEFVERFWLSFTIHLIADFGFVLLSAGYCCCVCSRNETLPCVFYHSLSTSGLMSHSFWQLGT